MIKHFKDCLPVLSFYVTIGLLITSPITFAQAKQEQSSPLLETKKLSREVFQELIEINTSHRIGITKAAEAMAARLRTAGFPSEDVQLLGPLPNKQNLVVRLRGNSSTRPILFLAHLDVVEARPEDWSVDPFKFLERDGYFYGRGTTDIKSEAADLVTNMIRLRMEHLSPRRDLILALTDDEEAGGQYNGVAWLLEHHRDLIDAEYCINADGGGGEILNGRHVLLEVQTGEKVYLSFQLEVRNRGGHSSLPVKDNAIYQLARGLIRLSQFDFPIELNETSRTFFQRMARSATGQPAQDMLAVSRQPFDGQAAARLAASSPYYNALVRTTCVATQLSGGHAENALPQTARAVVNCRLLPEDSAEAVQRSLERVLADKNIVVSRLEEPRPSPISPLRQEVLTTVEQITKEMWSDVVVTPVISTGASDGVYLRRAGVPVYGVSGMFGDINDTRAHGRDERIGVKEFYDGVDFMYRLMKMLALAGN